MSTCRRMQIDPYLSQCTKLKSKWIKDFNINPVTLNLIGEKVRSSLQGIDTGDHFQNITLVAQTLRAAINKWDLLKLKICKAKYMVKKTKKQKSTEGGKIITNTISDRKLSSKYK